MNIYLQYKGLPAKISVRHGSLWFVEAPQKSTARNMNKNIVRFEANCKHAWTLPYFFGVAITCIFRQSTAFHPNNLVHLRLSQHSHGAQLGASIRMQLRRSHIVVSPDIMRLF